MMRGVQTLHQNEIRLLLVAGGCLKIRIQCLELFLNTRMRENKRSKKGNFMLSKLLMLLLGSSLFLIGCQTNTLKEFEKITPGMEKDDVLSYIGSPSTSLRLHGRDRWIYVFYTDRIRFEKEVHFFEGGVIYVGEKWEAPGDKSAYAIDQEHAKQDQDLDRQREADMENRQHSYENFVRATEDRERVRYMPEFTPVQ